jgi:tol-pal system protein YbgF
MRCPSLRALPATLALCGFFLGAGSSQAALFEDDEARKAILDLRARQSQSDETSRNQIQQLTDQIQQLQRSLLTLNSQNEQLRADVAKLRGQDEQLLRDLSEIQRRQRDLSQSVDDRVRKLEPQSVTVDGKTFQADPDEKRLFDDAMASLRTGDFDKAGAGFNHLLRRYPETGYVDATRFWLGNVQYGKQAYKEAIATLRSFLAGAPENLRAPEALLSIANCQAEMKENKAAKRTLEDLIKQFPKSEAAQAAKERLLALK